MKTDWPGLMRAGLRGLGLTPDAFWRLTPLELMTMLGADPGSLPMGRQRLAELAARYPDAGPIAGKDKTDGRPAD